MILVASLFFVDYVISFDEDTPENLINKLSPDFLIKGDEYKDSDIVGAESVISNGGKVIRIPMREGQSTSMIIKRIKELP
jgi:D-beta-D-heptose 7-phosphate kinase/D-beta-D-heptose 1-phosphate adenosyltransferase